MRNIILAAGVFAMSIFPVWADGISGRWSFPEQNLGFVTLDMSLLINSTSVTLESICKYPDGVNTISSQFECRLHSDNYSSATIEFIQ